MFRNAVPHIPGLWGGDTEPVLWLGFGNLQLWSTAEKPNLGCHPAIPRRSEPVCIAAGLHAKTSRHVIACLGGKLPFVMCGEMPYPHFYQQK